jgi:hypothetical protein
LSELATLQYPERSHCVQCGAALDPGQLECLRCYPGPAEHPTQDREGVEAWLRRSRGRLLLGIAFFGWILPWAYLGARKAQTLYREDGLDDPKLLRWIHFHGFLAVVAFLLWAMVLVALFLPR